MLLLVVVAVVIFFLVGLLWHASVRRGCVMHASGYRYPCVRATFRRQRHRRAMLRDQKLLRKSPTIWKFGSYGIASGPSERVNTLLH
jgi:hypothetical protein